MRNFLCGLLFAVLAPLASADTDISSIPLPPDLAIHTPEPAAPAELARFSGAWKGAWDGVLQHVLVVEKIDHDRNVAHVIYAHGANQNRNILQGKWVRLEGSFVEGKLKVKNLNGAWLTYALTDKGEMDARYMRGSESRSTMSRFDPRPQ